MSHVFYNLYLGSLHDAMSMTDADMVVNCTPEMPFFAHNAQQIRVPIVDLPSYSDKLYEIATESDLFQRMASAMLDNKKILVHCHMGMSRSASLLACYIMYYCKQVNKQEFNLPGVVHFLKTRRPIVFHDGYNFLEAMERYAVF